MQRSDRAYRCVLSRCRAMNRLLGKKPKKVVARSDTTQHRDERAAAQCSDRLTLTSERTPAPRCALVLCHCRRRHPMRRPILPPPPPP